jgi:virulence factor Mce-like protein
MRRVIGTAVVLLVAAGLVVLGLGAGSDDSGGTTYKVELDNAFGLTEGADVKIAGVRSGKIKKLALDRTDMRALVTIGVDREGFGDLRSDVRCETRPQSLIGEYFIDCRPGTSPRRLKNGATIPVEQTETTVPVDLVNDIMRRPYRERFTILLSELGAGLSARGDDLDATIRRAVPALRQVDRLLAILREQRVTIRELYRNADRVFTRVADDRGEVARFVDEARDTAATAALEDDGIRAQWRTFPTFLRELRPTLARLEDTADEQIPALRNLGRAAPLLEQLFRTLGPYAEASQPAIRTLGDAAEAGRGAVRAALPPVAELRRAVDDLPEAANNLALTLEHLDDPRFATEKDARAGRGPDGGYTGLEALLRYFFAQSQAINLFDANSYILKASIFLDRECANYAGVEDVKSGKSPERCRAWLGKNQPGITSADPTKSADATAARRTRGGADRDTGTEGAGQKSDQPGDEDQTGGDQPAGPGRSSGRMPQLPQLPQLPPLPRTPELPQAPRAPPEPRATGDLLDFLLGS